VSTNSVPNPLNAIIVKRNEAFKQRRHAACNAGAGMMPADRASGSAIPTPLALKGAPVPIARATIPPIPAGKIDPPRAVAHKEKRPSDLVNEMVGSPVPDERKIPRHRRRFEAGQRTFDGPRRGT